MERKYLAEVLDGLLGEDREDCRVELLRRGFSEAEVANVSTMWESFRATTSDSDAPEN